MAALEQARTLQTRARDMKRAEAQRKQRHDAAEQAKREEMLREVSATLEMCSCCWFVAVVWI